MNTLLKLLAILVMMNIFVYIGVNFSIAMDASTQLNPELKFYWKGDLIERFMSDSLDDITANTRDNWTDYNIDFSGNMSTFVQKSTGRGIGTGFIAFLDELDIVWSFLATLWNISFSPIILFANFRVPIFVGLMIGIPMIILYTTTIILAIRGVGD